MEQKEQIKEVKRKHNFKISIRIILWLLGLAWFVFMNDIISSTLSFYWIGAFIFVWTAIIISTKIWSKEFWTDREGNRLTFKQFIQRWKEGAEGITPLQQTKASLIGSYIIIIGILWGIVYAILLKQWWLLTILVGAIIINIMTTLAYWQRKRLLAKMEEQFKLAKQQIDYVG